MSWRLHPLQWWCLPLHIARFQLNLQVRPRPLAFAPCPAHRLAFAPPSMLAPPVLLDHLAVLLYLSSPASPAFSCFLNTTHDPLVAHLPSQPALPAFHPFPPSRLPTLPRQRPNRIPGRPLRRPHHHPYRLPSLPTRHSHWCNALSDYLAALSPCLRPALPAFRAFPPPTLPTLPRHIAQCLG